MPGQWTTTFIPPDRDTAGSHSYRWWAPHLPLPPAFPHPHPPLPALLPHLPAPPHAPTLTAFLPPPFLVQFSLLSSVLDSITWLSLVSSCSDRLLSRCPCTYFCVPFCVVLLHCAYIVGRRKEEGRRKRHFILPVRALYLFPSYCYMASHACIFMRSSFTQRCCDMFSRINLDRDRHTTHTTC